MAVRTATGYKLTYEDYAAIPLDGQRHEIVDGEHYVNPAPSLYHQDVSRRMQFQLYVQIEQSERGVVYNAPVDLQLFETDVVQPDLVVVLRENRHILTPKKIKEVPDLVVEILSPSTTQHDCTLKKELYRRAGVPEYWIVDPDEHSVDYYRLESEDYVWVTRDRDAVEFGGLPGVQVDLREVW